MDLWWSILEFHINTVNKWQCCREVCKGFFEFTRRPQNPCRYIFASYADQYVQTRYGYYGKLNWRMPRKKLANPHPQTSESESEIEESESEIEESV